MATDNKTKPETQDDLFHGAAIIQPDGQEVPITDDMIEEVFEDLTQSDVSKH